MTPKLRILSIYIILPKTPKLPCAVSKIVDTVTIKTTLFLSNKAFFVVQNCGQLCKVFLSLLRTSSRKQKILVVSRAVCGEKALFTLLLVLVLLVLLARVFPFYALPFLFSELLVAPHDTLRCTLQSFLPCRSPRRTGCLPAAVRGSV